MRDIFLQGVKLTVVETHTQTHTEKKGAREEKGRQKIFAILPSSCSVFQRVIIHKMVPLF